MKTKLFAVLFGLILIFALSCKDDRTTSTGDETESGYDSAMDSVQSVDLEETFTPAESTSDGDQAGNSDESTSVEPYEENSYSNLGSELNLNAFDAKSGVFNDISAIPKVRTDLRSMMVVTKKMDGNTNLRAAVPGFAGLSLEKNDSNINAYYIETKVVGNKVYAVGYSVHYLFKKIKRGISLNNLSAVSASVTLDNGKTEVYYSIKSYGMTGKPLTKYFKPVINKPFDVEGYAIMQSSIDGIHAIMSDETLGNSITYEPQEIDFIKPADLRN